MKLHKIIASSIMLFSLATKTNAMIMNISPKELDRLRQQRELSASTITITAQEIENSQATPLTHHLLIRPTI